MSLMQFYSRFSMVPYCVRKGERGMMVFLPQANLSDTDMERYICRENPFGCRLKAVKRAEKTNRSVMDDNGTCHYSCLLYYTFLVIYINHSAQLFSSPLPYRFILPVGNLVLLLFLAGTAFCGKNIIKVLYNRAR